MGVLRAGHRMRGLIALGALFACEAAPPPGAAARDAGTARWSIADAGRGDDTTALVRFVIDGDTLVLDAEDGAVGPDGRPLDGEKVRLLGIDAPELQSMECGAEEAASYLRGLARGRIVRLEFGTTLRGDFGRLLAYVFVGQQSLGEAMLEAGWATTYPMPHARDAHYQALARAARRDKRGIWQCR